MSQDRLSGPLSTGSNAAAATNGGAADGPNRLISAVKGTAPRAAQAFPTGRRRPRVRLFRLAGLARLRLSGQAGYQVGKPAIRG